MSQEDRRPRSRIPSIRVRAANDRPADAQRHFVLYWMTAFRRTRYNFALQRAVECSTPRRLVALLWRWPARAELLWRSRKMPEPRVLGA